MNPTAEQCIRLLQKHGISVPETTEAKIISAIREAYRAGRNADVMKIAEKKGPT